MLTVKGRGGRTANRMLAGEGQYNLRRQHRATWQERATAAVKLWADSRASHNVARSSPVRIADLGAGSERLRGVIASQMGLTSFEYYAYDLLPQRSSTSRLDLRHASPRETFDVVFCLGLLEYIAPDNSFVARLPTLCSVAVVSYVFLGSAHGGSIEAREALGWVRSQDETAFEDDFKRSGFVSGGKTLTNGGQTGIWLWTK